MSRRRYISTDMSIDKRLNRLAVEHSDFAALLYTWMVPHAADDATLNGDVDELIVTVIPHRRDKSAADVQSALVAMCSMGLIQWDGETIFFPVEAFYRYQTYISAEKRRIADFADERRETPQNAEGSDVMADSESTPQNADERRETPQNTASLSLSLSPSLSPSVTPSGSGANAPRTRKPAFQELTEEEHARLVAKWEKRIPNVEDVIALSLEHENHWKYPTGQFRYVDNWCRREWQSLERYGATRPPPRVITFDDDLPLPEGMALPEVRFQR